MARKTKAEAELTKQRLLQSALDVMSERSYSSVSMTEIANRIGYSKGAVYWHFKNKHDLLIKLVDSACAQSEEEMAKATSGEYSLEGLRQYYKYMLGAALRNKILLKFHKLMMRRHEWPEDVSGKIDRILSSRLDNECKAVEKLLTGMQSDGKMRADISAKETAAVISAVFQGLLMFQVEIFFYKIDFSKYIDFIFDAIQDKLLQGTS